MFYTAIVLITLRKQMKNKNEPCFNRIDFTLISSYIELSCSDLFDTNIN